jgi:uncharacterized RDD family membrane protein YckC
MPQDALEPNIANSKVAYAGFGMRMLASTIDCFIGSLLLLPFTAIYTNITENSAVQNMLLSGVRPEDIPPEQLIPYIKIQLFSLFLQMAIVSIAVITCWVYKSATPGKMLLKMKIVDAKTGEKPTTKQFILRYLGYLLSILPLGIGFIFMYYHKKHQGIHDKVAGTAVIYTNKQPLDSTQPSQ